MELGSVAIEKVDITVFVLKGWPAAKKGAFSLMIGISPNCCGRAT